MNIAGDSMKIFSMIAAVVAIIAAGLFISLFKFNQKKDRRQRLDDKQDLVCRFVIDGKGAKIGESIAVDKDILVIKSGEKYLGVPLKHVKKQKNRLQVRGLISRENAEKLGEQWLKHSNRSRAEEKNRQEQ